MANYILYRNIRMFYNDKNTIDIIGIFTDLDELLQFKDILIRNEINQKKGWENVDDESEDEGKITFQYAIKVHKLNELITQRVFENSGIRKDKDTLIYSNNIKVIFKEVENIISDRQKTILKLLTIILPKDISRIISYF